MAALRPKTLEKLIAAGLAEYKTERHRRRQAPEVYSSICRESLDTALVKLKPLTLAYRKSPIDSIWLPRCFRDSVVSNWNRSRSR